MHMMYWTIFLLVNLKNPIKNLNKIIIFMILKNAVYDWSSLYG